MRLSLHLQRVRQRGSLASIQATMAMMMSLMTETNNSMAAIDSSIGSIGGITMGFDSPQVLAEWAHAAALRLQSILKPLASVERPAPLEGSAIPIRQCHNVVGA